MTDGSRVLAHGWRKLVLVLLGSTSTGCPESGDDCIDLGERIEFLRARARAEDATDCGVTNYMDDPYAHETAACLVLNLQQCKPASGQFFAQPPVGDYQRLHWVFVSATCEAQIVEMIAPKVDDVAYTEVACETLEATGDTSVLSAGDCGEKRSFPFCEP